MKYALALAGGGTRGAFQAGVWRALMEMGIEISAIAGTSIGAVNGAMFAMGADPSELWLKTHLEDIVELSGTDGNLFSIRSAAAVAARELQGGLDTAPFRKLLTSLIDERKLRASSVAYGLCAFSVTNKKSVELFAEEIPEGKMVDYILASSCFPGFKPVVIDGVEYTDGGVQNNLPANMLISRGYDTIITVSVNGIGFVRDVDRCGTNIISIESPVPEVGLMDFDHEGIGRSIESGYLETMRAFGRCRGERFFIESRSYNEFIRQCGFALMSGLEEAARLAGADRCRLYTADELVREVLTRYQNNAKLKYMTGLIKNSRSEFLREKLDILGNTFKAANAVVYMLAHTEICQQFFRQKE